MLQFHLGRIPVRVHFSHLVLSLIIAFLWQGSGPENVWPFSVLTTPAQPGYVPALLAYLVLVVGIVFVSVLVHELGHALVAKAYGYRPVIELISLGGRTFPNANETIPWHKDVLLTLAGPVFGFLLAGAALVAALSLSDAAPRLVLHVLAILVQVNVFWGLANLIPVYPLDGGKITLAVLTRAIGSKGFLVTQVISLVLATGAAAWGVAANELFIAVLFGMWAWQSLTLIRAWQRGELNPGAARHPTELALEQAQALYQQGKRDEAKRLAEAILTADASPQLLSRVHHLLGWIALKAGEGRPALDHFSQVQRHPVENKALAAAFSLVGDDVRAASFWELASREEPGDSTLLHEWAGTLLRLGREDDVRRMRNVDLAHAYSCAERVPFIRGDFGTAASLAERSLELVPRADTAYDGACARARLGDKDGAVRLLERASLLGFRDASYAESDEDLASLHGYGPFHAWLSAVRESAAS